MEDLEEDENRNDLDMPSDLDEAADDAYGMEDDDEEGEEEGEAEGLWPKDNEGSFPSYGDEEEKPAKK